MYLLLSDKGYFITLSKDVAQQKCRYLNIRKEGIITCASFDEAKRYIKQYKGKEQVENVTFNKLTLWQSRSTRVLINIPAGESWTCLSDGMVFWERRGKRTLKYKVSHDKLYNDKKTITLLNKFGSLVFYDFISMQAMCLFADGRVEVKSSYP